MSLLQSIGKNTKAYGLATLLLLGSVGVGLTVKNNAKNTNQNTGNVSIEMPLDEKYKHLYYKNVLEYDQKAIDDAIKAYNLTPPSNFSAALQKIDSLKEVYNDDACALSEAMPDSRLMYKIGTKYALDFCWNGSVAANRYKEVTGRDFLSDIEHVDSLLFSE